MGTQAVHLDFHTAAGLWASHFAQVQCCFTSTETVRTIKDEEPSTVLRARSATQGCIRAVRVLAPLLIASAGDISKFAAHLAVTEAVFGKDGIETARELHKMAEVQNVQLDVPKMPWGRPQERWVLPGNFIPSLTSGCRSCCVWRPVWPRSMMRMGFGDRKKKKNLAYIVCSDTVLADWEILVYLWHRCLGFLS